MDPKTVAASTITIVQQMRPQDANLAGNVHGGVIMMHIDIAGSIVAARHAGTNVVTASIDRLDFHSPVYIGDLLRLKASLNLAGKTSMEVGVRVEAENMFTGEVRHTASAYLTFVALDEKHKPRPVPELLCETEDEKRRNDEARARHAIRLEMKRNGL